MSSKREQRAARAECTVQLPDDLREKAAHDAAMIEAIARGDEPASPHDSRDQSGMWPGSLLAINCELDSLGTPISLHSKWPVERFRKPTEAEAHCFDVIAVVRFPVDCRGNVRAATAAGLRKYAAEQIAAAERLEAEAEADRGR